jgi:hypothetical protein
MLSGYIDYPHRCTPVNRIMGGCVGWDWSQFCCHPVSYRLVLTALIHLLALSDGEADTSVTWLVSEASEVRVLSL